jgi:LDH2 family malate/lactate/ureidoglycolate dehydrogenase
MQIIKATKLREIGIKILVAQGVKIEDAWSVMDDLIQNDLMGDDVHGIVHLKNYVAAIKEGKYNIK